MNGDFFPLKQAFSEYLRRFYAGLYPDTPAMQEFVARGIERAIVWAPDRMVDAAEEMLASYRKNANATQGANSLFPVIIVGMAKDYAPTTGDWGARQVGRRLVHLVEPTDADPSPSVYGYRQAMGDVRTQVVIFAAESATARSIAAQFALFVGERHNRRFYCRHTWGQYRFDMPCMLETPDLMFANVQTDQPNITVLAGDLDLKATFPYLDAPKPGEPNDGSAHNPPGYPVLAGVEVINNVVNTASDTTDAGTTWDESAPQKPRV